MALVRITEKGGGWIMSFDRAPANAIDITALIEIERAVKKACISESCTSLVMTGHDGFFSAGIDVKAVAAYNKDERAEMLRAANRMIRALYGAPIPTVAAVNGHALGAGLVLALACDVRLAAQGNYDLGLTEAQAGVPFPAGPLEVVRAELSADTIRQAVMGAEVFAPSSRRAGWFLDRVVPRANLIDEALAEAARRSELPGYGAVKRQLRAPALARMDEIIEKGDDPLSSGWLQS